MGRRSSISDKVPGYRWIRVLEPKLVRGYGLLEPGPRFVSETLADFLIGERFAVPISRPVETPEDRPTRLEVRPAPMVRPRTNGGARW